MENKQSDHSTQKTDSEFAQHATESRPSLIAELWEFLATNKKWWLTPIVLVLLLVGGLILCPELRRHPLFTRYFRG